MPIFYQNKNIYTYNLASHIFLIILKLSCRDIGSHIQRFSCFPWESLNSQWIVFHRLQYQSSCSKLAVQRNKHEWRKKTGMKGQTSHRPWEDQHSESSIQSLYCCPTVWKTGIGSYRWWLFHWMHSFCPGVFVQNTLDDLKKRKCGAVMGA